MLRKPETLVSIVVTALISGLAGCSRDGAPVAPAAPAVQQAADYERAPHMFRRSIVAREGWSPDGFFSSPNELLICEAISSGDRQRLVALLDSGVELNTPGKFGFTVLHWAYAEDDLEAFELLLKYGADPDQRFTGTFRWSSSGPVDTSMEPALGHYLLFRERESILFNSLLQHQGRYCFAALPYSAKGEHLTQRGETLMIRFLGYGRGYDYESGLQQLIDAGVDLNAKGHFGETGSHRAFDICPSLCLQLLEAGADPSIKDGSGRDVADWLEVRLAHLKPGEPADRYEPLIRWLEANYRPIDRAGAQPAETGVK